MFFSWAPCAEIKVGVLVFEEMETGRGTASSLPSCLTVSGRYGPGVRVGKEGKMG